MRRHPVDINAGRKITRPFYRLCSGSHLSIHELRDALTEHVEDLDGYMHRCIELERDGRRPHGHGELLRMRDLIDRRTVQGEIGGGYYVRCWTLRLFGGDVPCRRVRPIVQLVISGRFLCLML